MWFEAHKVPREAWVGELETIEEKIQKQKEKEQKEKVSLLFVSAQICFVGGLDVAVC